MTGMLFTQAIPCIIIPTRAPAAAHEPLDYSVTHDYLFIAQISHRRIIAYVVQILL